MKRENLQKHFSTSSNFVCHLRLKLLKTIRGESFFFCVIFVFVAILSGFQYNMRDRVTETYLHSKTTKIFMRDAALMTVENMLFYATIPEAKDASLNILISQTISLRSYPDLYCDGRKPFTKLTARSVSLLLFTEQFCMEVPSETTVTSFI